MNKIQRSSVISMKHTIDKGSHKIVFFYNRNFHSYITKNSLTSKWIEVSEFFFRSPSYRVILAELVLDILKMESWTHRDALQTWLLKILSIFLHPSAKTCVFCWWDGVIASVRLQKIFEILCKQGKLCVSYTSRSKFYFQQNTTMEQYQEKESTL